MLEVVSQTSLQVNRARRGLIHNAVVPGKHQPLLSPFTTILRSSLLDTEVLVSSYRHVDAKELTDVHATEAGFRTYNEMISIFKHQDPDFNDNSRVTLIEYRAVEPLLLWSP